MLCYDREAKSFDLGGKLNITHLISADAVAGRNVGTFKRKPETKLGSIPMNPAFKKVEL